jgi:membrane protease YdiL (CAAX protease family)
VTDSKPRAALEAGAVVLTGLVFLFFENVLHLKLAFLVPCAALWTGYIVMRVWRDRGIPAAWGFRRDTLKPAALYCLAFSLAAALAIAAYRLAAGWRPLPEGAVWIFALYPLWSLVQQFLIQALVASNFERLGMSRGIIVPAAAMLFGLSHLPDWPLAGLCAVAGLAWTWIFLKTRNLWPLALSHAWLGAMAYYWILERDPWLEMFPPQ